MTLTTQKENCFFGYDAGLVHTGSYNTFIGMQSAGAAAGTGSNNAAVGHYAMGSSGSSGGCAALGLRALGALGGGDRNAGMGRYGGGGITTGDDNTCIGNVAGMLDGTQSQAILTTGSNNILIGSKTSVAAADTSDAIAIGDDLCAYGADYFTTGISANRLYASIDGSSTSWSADSDERLKENIETSTAGLSFINDLRPVTYNWKKLGDIPEDMNQYIEGSEKVCRGKEYGKVNHGFIAQEVKEVIDNHPEIKEGFGMWMQDDFNVQGIADGELIPMLVKAVQELTARIEELEGE